MDFATAKQIIDRELSNASDVEEFEFDLFGGEPFLEFDLIKQITEYICESKGDIPCTVFATTRSMQKQDCIYGAKRSLQPSFV